MKITELKARKSECIRLAQSGFTFEEASEVNQLIIDNLKARIAELEGKLMQCPRCGDPITNELGDNPICGACALASELNVKTLQERVAELEAENAIFRNADYESLQCGSRIAELEKAAVVWHKYPDEKPEYGVRCLCIRHESQHIWWWLDAYHQFDTNPTGRPGADSSQPQFWAYLPKPPEEGE